MLTLKILGALAALAIGVWLGMPGRYEQSYDDLEQNFDAGRRHHRKVKRVFTPMAWVKRKADPKRGATQRKRGFRLETPEDR